MSLAQLAQPLDALRRNEVDPVSLPARVATLVVAFLAVVAGVLWVVFDIIGPQPQTENYTAYAKRRPGECHHDDHRADDRHQ